MSDLNPLAKTCHMCQLAKTRKKLVWGEGNLHARIMFIGEGPNYEEDRSGHPSTGKTGKEFDVLLKRNRIPREDTYVTNITKCYYIKKTDKDDIPQECIDKCSQWLLTEIEQVRPEFIIPLGKHATEFFLEDVRMDFMHGIPYYYGGLLLDYVPVIIPAYHPAAGLHNDSMMVNVQSDFNVLGEAWRGKMVEPRVGLYADEYPDPDYQLLTNDVYGLYKLSNALHGEITHVAIDTEWARNNPWCLTFSVTPGKAYMIKANATKLLLQFNALLRNKHIIIHNILYDWPVLTQMRIDLSATKPMDSMVMAYLLQDLPQGLKALAYRIAGMSMGSYSETVAPASFYHAMRYMAEILERTWEDPEPILEWKADNSPHIKHPQNIRKKVERRMMDQWFKGADVVSWWNNMDKAVGKSQVEAILGPLQAGELCDIDFNTALWYACRDADATLRVFPYLWDRITKEERE